MTATPPAPASRAEKALPASQQAALPLAAPEPSPLEAELIGYGITPTHAAELVRQHAAEHIRTMIEYLEYEKARKPGKIDDQAAWMYSAIRDGRGQPKGFITQEERERQAEAARQRQQAEDENRRREREDAARERAERQAINAYRDSRTPEQLRQLEADALAQADEKWRATYEEALPEMKKLVLSSIVGQHIRRILQTEQAEA